MISLDIQTEKHGGTAAQDVETSTLLLNQRSTLVAKPIIMSLSLSFNLNHLLYYSVRYAPPK